MKWFRNSKSSLSIYPNDEMYKGLVMFNFMMSDLLVNSVIVHEIKVGNFDGSSPEHLYFTEIISLMFSLTEVRLSP